MSQPVVLIVEDDNIARFVFRKLISKLNITCFEAENGQDALAVIEKHNEITHVFLDINMPVMDGYGFLHFINSGNRHRDLNIYVTTVSDRRDFNDNIAKRNIDISNIKGYNKKPFNMAELAKSLLDGEIENEVSNSLTAL